MQPTSERDLLDVLSHSPEWLMSGINELHFK